MRAMNTLPLIVEPAELSAHLADPGLLLVDLCSAEKYRDGHIPGAVHLNTAELIAGTKPAPGMLPTAEQLSALFARIGLTPEKQVVCYDDEGGPWAGRLIWTLDVIGHKNYAFLNGGKTAWVADGLPLETGENIAPLSPLRLFTLDTRYIADADDILAHLADKNCLVWDARGLDEYTGEKAVSLRGGHIPGAIHCEWTELLDSHRALRLREDLAGYLQAKGITADKQIVMHCQTHRRSGLTYVAAKSLGYPHIRAYPGSWSEWGNADHFPVNTGALP
ncbi:MAG: sulfurtransferase [Pseudomonadales bacterium]|jgi:thiosulfate/3-mercaptopyruvate sulfurtransferase|nr:sulfurtransferase [Pseudomonadales bacterium]